MSVHVFTGSMRVSRASYDPELRTCYVLFPDGKRWAYQGVDPDEYEDFITAESPGRYLRQVLDGKTHGPAHTPEDDL